MEGTTREELVDISCEEGVLLWFDDAAIAHICAFVLEQEGIERPCSVSVSIVSDDTIHELNRTWRGVDRPTDVISLECEHPEDPDLAPDEICELGDIALAPVYIERQAQQFGVTREAEFCLLLVHGMLHLLGYDHIQEADAKIMEAREDELCALLGEASLGHVLTTRHSSQEQ